MAKIALLIGVDQYGEGLKPLASPLNDVSAIAQVLRQPDIGGFTEVITLQNPDTLAMEEAIESLFSMRKRDDLVLLFFSGHGVKDESGRLYFATRVTRQDEAAGLVKATAVPVSFVQDIMSNSRSQRQILVLDCCFSGAFAEGMTAKDDGSVAVREQLGGEGRAVLTSSTSMQYSFERDGDELSTYTRYIVEGLETGAADLDSDGSVSVDELHEYASRKVRETAPAMKPEIYVAKQGYKIQVARAPIGDPKLRYRKEVELFASRGAISAIGHSTLNVLRERLALSQEEATAITAEVLKPYQAYQESLRRYEKEFLAVLQREPSLSPETRQELSRFQHVLGLRKEDVDIVEAEAVSRQRAIAADGAQKQVAEAYTQALNAFRNGQWDIAAQGFEQVLSQQPNYEQANEKRKEAQRQQQLSGLYEQAELAYEQQDWATVIVKLEEVVRRDASYRDAAAKLEAAKRSYQASKLYSEARQCYRAGQWRTVLDKLDDINTLVPQYPDTDQLAARATRKLNQPASRQAPSNSPPSSRPRPSASPPRRADASPKATTPGMIERMLTSLLVSVSWIVLGAVGSGESLNQRSTLDDLYITFAFLGAVGGAINGGMFALLTQPPQTLQVNRLGRSVAIGAVVGGVGWFLAELLVTAGNSNNIGWGALIGSVGGVIIGVALLWYAKGRR